MKPIPSVLSIILVAGLSAPVAATSVDQLGAPARVPSADRTIVVDDQTTWVNVAQGEIVAFEVVNGKKFAWQFDGTSDGFDLNEIAPAGALNGNVVRVYVMPAIETYYY